MARIVKRTSNEEVDKITRKPRETPHFDREFCDLVETERRIRLNSARAALEVLAYLLDGAIEREDDGGFVTVTILKQKFDVLKNDYTREIEECDLF